MHAARLHGVAAIMEHPEFPSWIPASKKPASSSLVPEMVDLVATPETDQASFDQGTLGARSVKPTTLTLVNLPHVKRALNERPNQSRCTREQRKALEAIIGLDDQGRYIIDNSFGGADVRNYSQITSSSTWQAKIGISYKF